VTSPDAIRLSVRERAEALLDDPFSLTATAPDGAELRWRGRIRDDDGRVWRASAGRAHDLTWKWAPAKEGTGPIAALASLRPVAIDVRVEAEDGRGAARTLTRALVLPGVKSRRWRGDVVAALHLPAADEPASTLLIDATAGEEAAAVGAIAGPLLASRGVLTLVVPPPKRETPDLLDRAREQLSAVPAVAASGAEPIVLPARPPRLQGDELPEGEEEDKSLAVVLPPNVPAREPGPEHTRRRVATWDGLLTYLGARGR